MVDRLNENLGVGVRQVYAIVRSTFLGSSLPPKVQAVQGGPKIRRKHSRSGLRCPICSPLRCTKAKS